MLSSNYFLQSTDKRRIIIDSPVIISELDYVMKKWEELRSISKHDDLSDVKSKGSLSELVVMMSEAIHRFAPPGSQYLLQTQKIIATLPDHVSHSRMLGIIRALRDAYTRGQLQSLVELVHADVFADFLDMASHLLDEGYKDAAAVMIGSVLEEQLKKLSMKHSIALTDANGKARKTSSL